VSDGIVAAVQAMAPAERAAIHEQLQDNPARHEVSLTQLAVELVVARASAGDAIRQVAVTSDWVIIERGDDALSPGSFRLDDHVHDHGGFTTP
jgi:hypothetical protein